MKFFSSYKNCEAAADKVTNTAFVEFDGDFKFSASTEFMLISSSALSVTQYTDKPLVCEGQYLTYHINVTNNGPSDATGVVLKDILPSESILSYVNLSVGTFTCFGNVIEWNIGKLKSSSSSFASITIIPMKHGIISNYAAVSEDEFNPDPRYFSILNTLVKSPPSRGIELF